MKIKFIGATESVTGSKHLLITEEGRQILLDCGMYQGMGEATDKMNKELGLNPENIDAVLLSHAHIDHSGSLPYLMAQGFKGKIYCTEATLDVCNLLLLDSANIHESDVYYINKRRAKKGMPPIKPLYTVRDAEKCLKLFKPIPVNSDFNLNNEISFKFTDNGHIIGSATINITARENGKITKLAYTGDVGRYTDPIMKAPDNFPQADYVICESTYGGRVHESIENIEERLLQVVIKTCVTKKGKLIIPAFSLGRTQEILYLLDKLKNQNKLPKINTYVDSPLSTGVTKVVRDHPESFNDELKAYLKTDPNPFGFDNLTYITEAEESKALNLSNEPCIIISASGMGDAGRVKHHIKNALPHEKNTVLISGYCAPRTLGARLLSGEKEVHIFGDFFPVNAEIDSILSLSAHADQPQLIRFLSCQDKTKLKTIFLVHGDEDAKKEFKIKLNEAGFTNVQIPEKGETFVFY